MNEEKIEALLRQAPKIAAPPGLLRQLERDLKLPGSPAARLSGTDPRPWLQRWLPALSFTVFLLICVVVLGVQAGTLADLKQENAKLRAAVAQLEPLRAANKEFQRLQAEAQEVDRLRKDNAELQKLRAEVAQLRANLPEIEKLRAANQMLLTKTANIPGANSDADFFTQAKAKADRIACVNNLKQVCLAARIWAGDYNDIYPSNFICMTNEMATWKILQCPSDKAHTVNSWAEVAAGNVSYQLVSPGVDETNPNEILFICPIHHNIGMSDGSVQQLTPEKAANNIRVINGKTLYVE